MDKDEFERLKEEEKRHLREMRGLKQRYREAQRKKGLLDALRGLTNPEAEATHEEMVDRLTRSTVEREARLDVAMEDAGLDEDAAARAEQEEADREAVRKAEAEALVRQMKAQMGAQPGEAPTETAADAPPRTTPSEPPPPAGGKTIGRVPQSPEAGEAPAEDPGAKTIGRPRQPE